MNLVVEPSARHYGLVFYETNHPGAIVEVLGKTNKELPWTSIW